MRNYQKWTVIFCLLMSASIILGQVVKTFFAYAALTGWFLSALYVLAIVSVLSLCSKTMRHSIKGKPLTLVRALGFYPILITVY